MATQGTHGATRWTRDVALMLVYALSAFVAGAGILLDSHTDDATYLGQSALFVGAILLIGWVILLTGRQGIFLPAVVVLWLVWFLKDVPSSGVSGSEIWKSVIVIAIWAALAGAVIGWESRKKRSESARPDR